MPRPPASRPWGGPNHCGEPRAAAEPVADLAVLTVEPGPGFVARLREALRDTPAAQRVVIYAADPHGDNHPSHLGEGKVGVVTLPVSDTVKEVVNGRVRRTVPRETLVQVIGPWVFDREALVDALRAIAGPETQVADMIGLCDAARVRVRVLPVR